MKKGTQTVTGNCKLDSVCAYAHNKEKKNGVEMLEQKVDALLKIIKDKNETINQLVKDVSKLKEMVGLFTKNKVDTIDDEITLDKNENDDECDDYDEDELRDEDDKNKDVTLEEIDNCLDADETASKKTKQIIKTSSANQNNKENENEKPWTRVIMTN